MDVSEQRAEGNIWTQKGGTGGRKKLLNEELHNFHSLPDSGLLG
jgi:hypothetical protein